MSLVRSRWAALGAAAAVTLGAGGIGLVSATNPGEAAAFVPITPCRLVDTRPAPENVGGRATPLGADEAYTVSAHGDNGNCTGIPAGATGLELNVTALGASDPTFLTIYPNGAARPTSSNLNPVPGAAPTPNAVTADLSAGGQFDIYNLAGIVDVIVDVTGYYIDHEHDDRYYIEAEIDAMTALTPVANGFIRLDGTLAAGTGVAATTYVDSPDTNADHYEITLTGINFTLGTYAATVTPACPGGDASVQAQDGKMLVMIEVFGTSNTLGACAFSFSVTPLAQS
jgi:hypothetical protein